MRDLHRKGSRIVRPSTSSRTSRSSSPRKHPTNTRKPSRLVLQKIMRRVWGSCLTEPRRLCKYFVSKIQSTNSEPQPVILLGNMDLAKDILEKRSANFSSRPIVPYSLCFDPERQYWASVSGRTHFIGRKLTASVMLDVRAGETERLQQFEALICMNRLLDDRGKNWFHEIERTSASMVLTAACGLHCATGEEPELKEIIACINQLVDLLAPSASIINVFPFLDKIPGPMPWRTRAAAFRKREDALYEKLVHEAVSGKASGMNTWAAAFAREDKPEGDQRRLLNNFSNAAIETTASSLQSFVLACVRFPQWILRAQTEIDAVVGPDRLPTFSDRPDLPYVEAVVRETLRWRPAVRFGIPHQSTADDIVEYQGKEYFIPKGSIIFAVAWAIEHDNTQYENSNEFRPERFLDERGKLESGYETSAFGFGRRVCPGIPFAERSLWINIAMILWAFNVRKFDPNSKMDLPFNYGDGDAEYSGGLTNPPMKFPAVFEPRSAHHAQVIRQEWTECEKDLNVLLPQHIRSDR